MSWRRCVWKSKVSIDGSKRSGWEPTSPIGMRIDPSGHRWVARDRPNPRVDRSAAGDAGPGLQGVGQHVGEGQLGGTNQGGVVGEGGGAQAHALADGE